MLRRGWRLYSPGGPSCGPAPSLLPPPASPRPSCPTPTMSLTAAGPGPGPGPGAPPEPPQRGGEPALLKWQHDHKAAAPAAARGAGVARGGGRRPCARARAARRAAPRGRGPRRRCGPPACAPARPLARSPRPSPASALRLGGPEIARFVAVATRSLAARPKPRLLPRAPPVGCSKRLLRPGPASRSCGRVAAMATRDRAGRSTLRPAPTPPRPGPGAGGARHEAHGPRPRPPSSLEVGGPAADPPTHAALPDLRRPPIAAATAVATAR